MMTIEGRDAFFRRLREALGSQGPLAERPEPPSGWATLQGQEQRVAALWQRLAEKRPALVEELAAAAQRGGWVVSRQTGQGAVDYVSGLAHQRGMRLVVRSAQPVFQRLPLDEALTKAGVRVVVQAREDGVSPQEGRHAAMEADLGITGAEYAIAATGTVALFLGTGLSRLTSLAPPVHLAIVEPGRVLETLDDLLAVLNLDLLRGNDLGSAITLISGPSRSADIEQTVTIGVHGPKETYLVILEG